MSLNVSSILEKFESSDRDIRHMALYDLHLDLQKESFRMDDSAQRQLADGVLKRLDDKSAEVQGLAVKCLAPFVKKMNANQIESSVVKLCNSLMREKEEKRDIANIALKTVIAEMPVEIAPGPVKKILPLLLQGIQETANEAKLDVIDNMNDLLLRFGLIVAADHEAIQKALIAELNANRIPIRKRATVALASLSITSNDKLFSVLVEQVISGIESSSGGDRLRTFIQCASAVSRTAGHRLGKFLNRLVPALLHSASSLGESEDEAKENILQAFENLVTRCPEQIAPFLLDIISKSKEMLQWDPNYQYSDEMEVDNNVQYEYVYEDAPEGQEGVEYEYVEEYEATGEEDQGNVSSDDNDSDYNDDDISWKVRKASAKCLSAIITCHPELLAQLYQELCSDKHSTLVDQFREREESVKLDIFQTFTELLNQTIITVSQGDNIGVRVTRQRPEVAFLQGIKNKVLSNLTKQLSHKSQKVREKAFSVLKDVALALRGELSSYVPLLVPAIITALTDRASSTTLKIETLSFLRLVLSSHPPATFAKEIDRLTSAVYLSVEDKYYKIISEALRVCGELVRVIESLRSTDPSAYANHSQLLLKTVYARLEVQDIDQDVKESAITVAGLMVAHLGDQLQSRLKDIYGLLLDRLRNEITRTTAVRAFGIIADANADLKAILSDLVNELASFLRKNNRPLKHATLVTLNSIVRSYSANLTAKLYDSIIEELSALVSDSDLQLARLALDLATNVLNASKATTTIDKFCIPKCLELLQSSLLQGYTLDALLNLMSVVVKSLGFASLFNRVLATVEGKAVNRQVDSSVAQCIAVLCLNSSERDRDATVSKFVTDTKGSNEAKKVLALYCLGEIGRHVDLSRAYGSVLQDIENCFEGSEEIKGAASFAMGNVTIGNLQAHLPRMLNQIRADPKRKYLLLHSLKETISRAQTDSLKPFVGNVLPLLFEYSEDEEEGVRNVVAECLGKLCLGLHTEVLPKLKESLAHSDVMKATVVTALKFTIVEQPQHIDHDLKSEIGNFLALLNKSQPVNVRRAAVLLFTAAAHNKPELIHDRLQEYLPNLYAESIIDRSLIKEVNIGPFKIKVDDGLELRKATFECMDTLLDTCLEYIDMPRFLAHVRHGLSDENADINMLNHLMLGKVCKVAPQALIASLDSLSEPLGETLKKKPRENAVEQEKERHDDLLRSATRAVFYITQCVKASGSTASTETGVPGVVSIPFDNLFNKVVLADPKLKAFFEQMKVEAAKESGESK